MAFKELGIRHNSMQNHLLESSQYNRNLSPSKLNINSNLKSINESNRSITDNMESSNNNLNSEFDQAFKKINRVKENFSTHKKFMDIVKS